MGREGGEVEAVGAGIQGNLAQGLGGIGEEEDAAGMGKSRGFADGEEDAGLVIGGHHGQDLGAGGVQGRGQGSQVYPAGGIHAQGLQGNSSCGELRAAPSTASCSTAVTSMPEPGAASQGKTP